MKIAIGSDHRGFEHKKFIINHFTQFNNIQWIDVGGFSSDRSDFPEFSYLVVKAILNKEADLGVLLCGSGIGMAIAANRFKGIYAGVAWSDEVARLAREHDNVNVLVLPSDFISFEQSESILSSWLHARFKGGTYQKRLEMIDC